MKEIYIKKATIVNKKIETVGIDINQNTDINDVLDFIHAGFFKICDPEMVIFWNTYIDDHWNELDDSDYYFYEKPLLRENDTQWFIYCNGGLKTMRQYLDFLNNELKYTKLLSSSQYR